MKTKLIIELIIVLVLVSGCSKEIIEESEKIKQCNFGGGEWKSFSNGCVDLCFTQEQLKSGTRGCPQAFTDGCDCGKDKCWNGEKCVENPKLEENLLTKEQLLKLLNISQNITDIIKKENFIISNKGVYYEPIILEEFSNTNQTSIELIITLKDKSEIDNFIATYSNNGLTKIVNRAGSTDIAAAVTKEGFYKLTNDNRVDKIYFNSPLYFA